MKDTIIKRVAKEYATDEASVMQEMREAIIIAAENPTPLWKQLFGDRMPDTEEFCKAVCDLLVV